MIEKIKAVGGAGGSVVFLTDQTLPMANVSATIIDFPLESSGDGEPRDSNDGSIPTSEFELHHT
jgi:hypothetical protein